MQQKLRERWQDDKELCFERMAKANKQKTLVPLVYEDGQLRAMFDGNKQLVKTFFDDNTSYELPFIQLYNILESQKCTRYLRDGIIYDAEDNIVADISIVAMAKKSKKKRCIIS